MMRMVPSTAHPENNSTTHIAIDCVHDLRRHGHLANEAGRIEIRSRCLRMHPDRPRQNLCFSADMRWSRMRPCLYTICQTRHIHDETGIAANSVPVSCCNSALKQVYLTMLQITNAYIERGQEFIIITTCRHFETVKNVTN